MTPDLLICGLGPAGRALAHRALARGLAVTVVDPHPDRGWTPTYAAWADELPGWVAPEVIAASAPRPVAWGSRRYVIDRRYVVFSTAALRDSLDIAGARVIAGRVEGITGWRPGRGPESVRLAGGEILSARRVIDARGVPRFPDRAEQTAYGLVLHRDPRHETIFMDWRSDNGARPGTPRSFLYAVPLGPDRMLFEETCLAGRPAITTTELRDRLHARLRSRGIEFDGTEPDERVRFALEGGRPGARRFGAAGGYLHPATGYSVAATLSAVDSFLARTCGHSSGTESARLAGAFRRPSTMRAVHTLRTAGLRALLALPPDDIPAFFDAFFELPPARQRAYLSGIDDMKGTAAAMTALFAAMPWRIRRILATATVGPALRN
ncbi:lycopene cyclase [Nocardia sp. NEAU-G5]|uniref:Lycopene cyclase n=1 Tax=Nocardia albiluteola TaxID=2842303 RepID=A0ABS6BAC4_9NOCA|nr:lycopene cyclase family protein [Nocardia albiluteola]MBU3067251.1 lycopene cyclase [Nocardia albiluteola]